MSFRDLRENYGIPNAKPRGALNRAIREECVGGEDLLDAMELISRVWQRIDDRNISGSEHAKAAIAELVKLRDVMDLQVCKTWNIKPKG